MAGFGPKIKEIIKNLPNNSYGRDCIFDRLLNYNTYCVNIGLGSNWIPFIHHLDYLNNVNFRFNKKKEFLLRIIKSKKNNMELLC